MRLFGCLGLCYLLCCVCGAWLFGCLGCFVFGAWSGYPCFLQQRGLAVRLSWLVLFVVLCLALDCSVVVSGSICGAWLGYPCFLQQRGLAVRLSWLVLFLSRRRPKGGKVWQRPKAADDPRVEQGLPLTPLGAPGRPRRCGAGGRREVLPGQRRDLREPGEVP